MCYQFLRKESTIFINIGALLDGFRAISRNIIGRNPSMVIPLLANQDLTPMLAYLPFRIYFPSLLTMVQTCVFLLPAYSVQAQ